MTISELAYELHKIDWMMRITPQEQMDAVKNYYQEVSEEDKEFYSLSDYIEDVGFASSMIYDCYEEFLDSEYLDEGYMEELFDNDELFAEYKRDLEENFD